MDTLCQQTWGTIDAKYRAHICRTCVVDNAGPHLHQEYRIDESRVASTSHKDDERWVDGDKGETSVCLLHSSSAYVLDA